MVDELATTYADRATFVHVEVWSDFEAREVNPAASEWIETDDGRILEPWLFLVDGDGTITHSWDNIAPRDEVEAALEALPTP
jgi:peroxiredoxin